MNKPGPKERQPAPADQWIETGQPEGKPWTPSQNEVESFARVESWFAEWMRFNWPGRWSKAHYRCGAEARLRLGPDMFRSVVGKGHEWESYREGWLAMAQTLGDPEAEPGPGENEKRRR